MKLFFYHYLSYFCICFGNPPHWAVYAFEIPFSLLQEDGLHLNNSGLYV